MIEYVQDRRQQGLFNGQFAPLADQSRYGSIFGVVDGNMDRGFSGHQIESGNVYSSDGRMRIGGTPFLDKNGKPHDVKVGGATYREYQIPREDIDRWNAYDGVQGAQLADNFIAKDRAKPARGGLAVMEECFVTETGEAVQYEQVAAPAPSASAAKLAGLAKAREARKANRAAAKQTQAT